MDDKHEAKLASLRLSAMRTAAAKRDRAEAKARRAKAKELIDVVQAEDAAQRRWRDRERRQGQASAAQAWVETGVGEMRRVLPARDHVVLFAATHAETGHVGVASSLACETTTALGALGRLVGQVNEWFERDGVEVRVRLRMSEHKADIAAEDKALNMSEAVREAMRRDGRGISGVPDHAPDKGRHVPGISSPSSHPRGPYDRKGS